MRSSASLEREQFAPLDAIVVELLVYVVLLRNPERKDLSLVSVFGTVTFLRTW